MACMCVSVCVCVYVFECLCVYMCVVFFVKKKNYICKILKKKMKEKNLGPLGAFLKPVLALRTQLRAVKDRVVSCAHIVKALI
jgi:hypothetical protein